MKTIAKTLGIATLALTLHGCASEQPRNETFSEYNQTVKASPLPEGRVTLVGKIVKVQIGSIPVGAGNWGVNHEFEYVMMQDSEGKMHTLLYPYTKAIVEQEATVTYQPLHGGISSVDFIQQFAPPGYDYGDRHYHSIGNVMLEADGIIAKNGITYK
ncbi:hypothetical protein HY639_00265 [Candidatus Woesearchaeota archaeon]|nr:hypothetical protein [Candidatus Woesearchaeota archaeon]